ncbi:tRNA (guanosine(37)-N1)-methyltransferase TrmD [Anaerovorax odorimutans]|uniref:tRNA (guanosine(37)-N1)-methyltransferase TrmD n=1 Tax=Anaerovorax odorimutans TaxID=109327 RepID=UPI0004100C53|nr:tRNA (guanosine(37)-N1)-methyltransferase TrmD [Anaerovorax odorimutans]
MKINVLTLFPNMFIPVTDESILGRAKEKGILDINLINIRDYSLDKHKRVDDYPFGGGAGMVMTSDPIFNALNSIHAKRKKIIYMSPRGKILDQKLITEFSSKEELVILCGHYEGIDQRIIDYWNMEEISVGDYILTGGELPAMILIDAVARLVPEVLGSSASHDEESIYSGLLEYPQYTKPRKYEDLEVPDVLISGNHKLIHLWKFEKSLEITKERRPDLFKKFIESSNKLTKDERKILEKFMVF